MPGRGGFSMRRTRQMPWVDKRWMLDGLTRGWIVPTNAIQPVVTNGTATPTAIALSVTTPAPTALGGGPAFGNGTPCVVTRIATTQTTPAVSATNTVTPTSWTPQANALLVVVASGWFNDGGSGATAFSIGDTFSGTGAWSTAVTAGSTMDAAGTYSNRQSIFVAQLGATPGNHSLTVTRTAGNINQWLWIDVYEVTGHNTSSPVGSTSTGDGFVGAVSTWTVETGMIPSRTTSAVFSGFIGDGSAVDSHVIPRGFTQGGNTANAAAFGVMSSAYKVGLAGFPRWFWGNNANGSVSINAEIKAASPSTSGVLTGAQGKVVAATTLDVAVDGIGGADVLMLVSVGTGVPAANDGVYTTTATFNSVSMTSLSKVHSNSATAGYVQVFYLKNPSSGSHNIRVTTSSTADIEVNAVVIGGTDGGTPVVLNSATGSSAAPGVTVTGNTLDRLEIGCLTAGNEIEYFSDNTELSIQNQNLSSGAGNAGMTVATGTGSSFTMDAVLLASDIWAFVGVEVTAAAASTNGTATPAAITISAVTSAPTTSGASNMTPAAVALTVVTPAPTATGNSNTTPAAVALSAVTSAPTASGNSNTTPTAIALSAVTSAPTAGGGSNTTPAAVALTVVTPAPTITGTANTTPTAIALTVVTSAPTASGASNTSPAADALTAIVPAPTVTGGSNTSPAAIARTVVTPAPTITGTANATPTAIALSVVTSAPTASGSSNTTPAAIALTVVVPAPTATGGSSTSPAAIALTVVTTAPTTTGDARAPPAAVVLAVTTPASTATGGTGASTSPAAITLAATLSAPTASGDAVAEPSAIDLVATVPDPTASGEEAVDGFTFPDTIELGARVSEGAVHTFTDDWTGTNGDPWDPAKWVMDGDLSTADIQSNHGHIALDPGGWVDATSVNAAPRGFYDFYVEITIADVDGGDDGVGGLGFLTVAVDQAPGAGGFVLEPSAGNVRALSGGALLGTLTVVDGDTVKVRLTGNEFATELYLWTSGPQPGSPFVTLGTRYVTITTADMYFESMAGAPGPWVINVDNLTFSYWDLLATITGGANTTPAAVALSVTTPAPTASGAAPGQAAPTTIALTATVPAPTASGSGVASPATIALTASLGTATATGGTGATATPAAITVAAAVTTPTGTGTANTSPATIALTVVTPAPQATGAGAGTAAPAAVMLSAVLGTATATGGATATPPHIDVTVITTTPVATGSVVYFPYWGARVG